MMTVDPVCGVEINKEDTRFIVEYRGRIYYFDSPNCQQEFENEPEAYAEPIPDRVYDEYGDRLDGSE
jgi:YHS domain-containing protein